MIRVYETPVGKMVIDSCVRCPDSTAKYNRVRIGNSFPAKFTSKLVGYYCSKLRRVVSGISICGECPLPVYPAGQTQSESREEQRKAEVQG